MDEISAMGRKAILIVGDVSNSAAVASMFEQVAGAFGRVDILVNNAAVRPHTHFLDMSEEEWHWVLGVGLNGPFYCSKAVVPLMVKQRSGCIINISGPDGFQGRKNRAHGVTVKAGIHGFTKALAYDLGEYGIRVNTVVPCMLQDTTRPPEWYPDAERTRERVLPEIPLGRFATKRDVANACLFLASDEASSLTGQAIHVNGGKYML